MRDVRTNIAEGTLDAAPSVHTERIIAPRGSEMLIAGLIRVVEVPRDLVEAIEAGETGALEECLRPEGDEGFHRVVAGIPLAVLVEGRKPTEALEFTGGWFYETNPEPENRRAIRTS